MVKRALKEAGTGITSKDLAQRSWYAEEETPKHLMEKCSRICRVVKIGGHRWLMDDEFAAPDSDTTTSRQEKDKTKKTKTKDHNDDEEIEVVDFATIVEGWEEL